MASQRTKTGSEPRKTSKRSSRGKGKGDLKIEVTRGGEGDLGEVVMTNDDLDEVKEQLVRAGRTAGARLAVRIDGA